MRNVATVFVLIFSLCMLAGCGAANQTGDEANFNATVLEINGNTVTVEPVDGEDILRSADRITFANDSLDEIGASVGDIVAITYTGGIMESYPAQVRAVSWSILEKAEPESMPQQSAEPAKEVSSVEDQAAFTYPKQAAEYLKMSLNGSALLYFNRANEHGELILPDVNYSNAQMSPDGNHILCKSNAGGAGEARWCGYSVVSLMTNPAETYAYQGEQWGFQDHIWLDNSLIGFASGGVIGGQEDIWKSIQLFDHRYNPLDVVSRIPIYSAGIAGIGYDMDNKQYIFAYAESMPAANTPFSINRLLLPVYNDKGEFVKEIGIPEEYQSPYSPNLMTLLPNNPVVTADGHILLSVQKITDIEQGNYNRRVLLVLSPDGQSIQELSYCDELRLSADGANAFATSYNQEDNSIRPAYLSFEGRKEAAVQELPDSFTVDGYSGQFIPVDAVMRGQHVYIMAENYTDDGDSFCGLFYWNTLEDDNAERIDLLQVLPGRGHCNLAGVDGEGFCYVLINGIVPESAEGDVREQLNERRERVLELIG